MFLYSAVSSPLGRSKRCTLHSFADLSISTPTRRLWEAFSHVAISARREVCLFQSVRIRVTQNRDITARPGLSAHVCR